MRTVRARQPAVLVAGHKVIQAYGTVVRHKVNAHAALVVRMRCLGRLKLKCFARAAALAVDHPRRALPITVLNPQ
jgi:hypothetical protein